MAREKDYVIDYMTLRESWRLFRILAEFVEGFEKLAKVDRAVTIFGSARTPEEHEDYRQAWYLGNMLAKAITYFAQGKMAGIVVGAKAPLVVASRSDPHETKLVSMALGVLLANNR